MGIISFLAMLFEDPDKRAKQEAYIENQRRVKYYFDQAYGPNAVYERHRRELELEAKKKGMTAEELLLTRIERRNKWREYQAYKRELMKDLPENMTPEEEKKFYGALWERKCELFPGYAGQERWRYKTEDDPDGSEPSKFDPENFIEYVRKKNRE